MNADFVLIAGFGGPERPEEVGPFLDHFGLAHGVPPARLREVQKRYHAIGGFSPYNRQMRDFSRRLEAHLRSKHMGLPVFLGMRTWHPHLKEVFREIRSRDLKEGLCIVMAPHRSGMSFGRYVQALEEAQSAAGASDVRVRFLGDWHTHPLLMEAHRASLRSVCPEISENGGGPWVFFTAHSIPARSEGAVRYGEAVHETAEGVAQGAGLRDWSAVFQSVSGDPSEWLGPGIQKSLGDLAMRGKRAALFSPIGFLCENLEILYDLDIEAKALAEKRGLEYLRAPTVLGDDRLVRMFGGLTEEACRE